MSQFPARRRAVRRAFAALTAVVVGAAGAVGIAAPAHAATIAVENTSGDVTVPNSLPWAVAQANLTPAHDTITFDLPLGTTISIVDLMTITESLTITGLGENDLIIEAIDTVFTADASLGTSSQIDVTITDIELFSTTGLGCGIDAINANVVVSNLTASGFDCAGVSVYDGALTATDVTLENNFTAISFGTSLDPTPPLVVTNAVLTGSASGIWANSINGTVTLTNILADGSTLYGLFVAVAGPDGLLTMTDTNTANASTAGHLIVVAEGATGVVTRPSSIGDPVVSSPGMGMVLQAYDDASLTVTGAISSNNELGGIALTAAAASLDLIDTIVDGNGVDCGCGTGGITVDIDDGDVTIINATVTGNEAEYGGGIGVNTYSGQDASLVISDSLIDDNTAFSGGGGISLFDLGIGSATGPVTITRTTVSGNSAPDGGGIQLENFSFNPDGPLLTIEQSTISRNASGDAGGGIFILKDSDHDAGLGIVDIVNSTISGNSATLAGGIFAFADAAATDSMSTRIRHSTVVNNIGDGGVVVEGVEQQVVLDHALIARNGASDLDFANDPELVTMAFSLIQVPGTGVVIPAGLGNQSGVDPLFGPLADNGGPTLTHTLLEGSPAFNKGDPDFVAPPAVDQRGLPRVVQIIDIGAVERTVTLPATGFGFSPVVPGAAVLLLLVGLMLLGLRRRNA